MRGTKFPYGSRSHDAYVPTSIIRRYPVPDVAVYGRVCCIGGGNISVLKRIINMEIINYLSSHRKISLMFSLL